MTVNCGEKVFAERHPRRTNGPTRGCPGAGSHLYIRCVPCYSEDCWSVAKPLPPLSIFRLRPRRQRRCWDVDMVFGDGGLDDASGPEMPKPLLSQWAGGADLCWHGADLGHQTLCKGGVGVGYRGPREARRKLPSLGRHRSGQSGLSQDLP